MSTVRIMIGFDCDRPRGSFVNSPEGRKTAEIKMLSLERISRKLDDLDLPRTYFICGQFLESMVQKFGDARLRAAFSPENRLCEIADHTYRHNVFKAIPTRPDKAVTSPGKVIEEYRINTGLFQTVFGRELSRRGLRAPLGHYQGLASEQPLLDLLSREGVLYLSSDLRDENHSVNPPLSGQNGKPRQPYFYTNGLLEIPTHGWHDTVFGGRTKTPVFEPYPRTYAEIIKFYRQMFSGALDIAQKYRRDFFLGLLLHPYNNALYDPANRFFADLKSIAQALGATFCQYRSVGNSPPNPDASH
jgi:hypothetical protein